MVYLIHFNIPFKHARHYIGFAHDHLFDARIECHRKGHGACIIRAVNEAGIEWKVVRTWPGEDGNFERKLKQWKKSRDLCPICREAARKARDKAVKQKQLKKVS